MQSECASWKASHPLRRGTDDAAKGGEEGKRRRGGQKRKAGVPKRLRALLRLLGQCSRILESVEARADADAWLDAVHQTTRTAIGTAPPTTTGCRPSNGPPRSSRRHRSEPSQPRVALDRRRTTVAGTSRRVEVANAPS